MGPEQGGLGGFDPYGDGLNRNAAATAGAGDVYDF